MSRHYKSSFTSSSFSPSQPAYGGVVYGSPEGGYGGFGGSNYGGTVYSGDNYGGYGGKDGGGYGGGSYDYDDSELEDPVAPSPPPSAAAAAPSFPGEGVHQRKFNNKTEMKVDNSPVYSTNVMGLEDSREDPRDTKRCPRCDEVSRGDLITMVIRCKNCDTKFCVFCSMLLRDGFPCGRKICRRKMKGFWMEEDRYFARHNLIPLEVSIKKKAKRTMQNIGYGVGVGCCGLASVTLVAAGVVGVPFTAGFSLLLIPAAAGPAACGRVLLKRRQRWVAYCKDKRRQTIRSQLPQSERGCMSVNLHTIACANTAV